MKTKKRFTARITANWLTSFLSPLVGTTIVFSLNIPDDTIKIIIISLISSTIVTGLVIAKEMEVYGNKTT